MEEKKQIKISLGTAIYIAIVVILVIIIVLGVLIYVKKGKNNLLIQGQQENTIENSINEIAEQNIEQTVIENKIEEAPKNNIESEESKKTVKEIKQEEVVKKQEQVMEEKIPEKIIEKNEEEVIENKQEPVEKQENVITFDEHFEKYGLISYPSNWSIEDGAEYYILRSNDNKNNYVKYYGPEIEEIDLEFMESLFNYYFTSGENYYFIKPIIKEGYNNNAEFTIERRVIYGQQWLIVHIKETTGNGICMYTIKNGEQYTVEGFSENANDKENINKIINSIVLPEG